MDKNRLFWLSGTTSVVIYVALFALLFFNISPATKKISLAGNNIAVDLISNERDTNVPFENKKIDNSKVVEKVDNRPTKQDDKIQKTIPVHEEPSINSAKDILKNFSVKDTKHIAPVESSHPSPVPTEQKQTQNAKQLLSSFSLKKNSPSVTFSTSGANSNEYLGRIASMIKAGWNPYKSDNGLSALIFMSIRSDGTFDFFIKKYSNSSDFNTRLNAYLSDLKTRGLPAPDDKKSVTVEFNFIAKD